MENKIKMMANPIILGNKRFKKSQTTHIGISRDNKTGMCVTIEVNDDVSTAKNIIKGNSKKINNIIRITPQNRRGKINYGSVIMAVVPDVIDRKEIYIPLIIEGSKLILNKRKIKLKRKELWVLYGIWKRTDGVVGKFVSRIHIKEEALKEMSDSEFIKSIENLEKYKIIEIKKDGYILKEKIKVIENID